MKRFLVALTALVVAAAGACSLNPQPFPPDNPDGAITSVDSGKGNDGSFGGDSAGNMPDAADDGAPVPQSDGGDADADASDASDALLDAPSDVIVDVVVVDVSLDVGTD